jgi:glycopeptide antibiotics resistance protein
MAPYLKKILVILPVCLLGIFYLADHSSGYRQVSGKRLLFLGITVLLLYGWIFLEVIKRKQSGLFLLGLQSSFYVYIFMVLTLTGYFILFREVSASEWWDKMMLRIERKDHVNLELFKIFKIYKLSNTQIVGNFLMLLPLGIYLPVLYRRASGYLAILIISLAISVVIESLQLITSYRSADVDDVILNTAGACCGFLIFAMAKLVASKYGARSVPAVTA